MSDLFHFVSLNLRFKQTRKFLQAPDRLILNEEGDFKHQSRCRAHGLTQVWLIAATVLCLSPYVCLTKPSSLSHSCLPLTHPVHSDSTCSGAGHAGAELGASPPCLSYRRGSWLLPTSLSSNEREGGGLTTTRQLQLQPPPRF